MDQAAVVHVLLVVSIPTEHIFAVGKRVASCVASGVCYAAGTQNLAVLHRGCGGHVSGDPAHGHTPCMFACKRNMHLLRLCRGVHGSWQASCCTGGQLLGGGIEGVGEARQDARHGLAVGRRASDVVWGERRALDACRRSDEVGVGLEGRVVVMEVEVVVVVHVCVCACVCVCVWRKTTHATWRCSIKPLDVQQARLSTGSQWQHTLSGCGRLQCW